MQEITLLYLRDIHRVSLPNFTLLVFKQFAGGKKKMFFFYFLISIPNFLFMVYSTDPPRVHLESLNFPDNTVTIVAGNKLRLEVPISGEPAPRVVWMKGERVGYNFF